jgi:hypothetical protein
VERISRSVIHPQDTIMTKIARTLALFLTASVLHIPMAEARQSKAAAEYLIVEHTDQLLIYSKYQQRIHQQEKEAFVPFVPLRVLDSGGVLNDNYTPCMKVELDGSIFYLIKNDADSFMGAENIGFNHLYKNAVSLQDTVQVFSNTGTVLISPDKTQRFALQKDEKLIRYFQDGSQTYVRLLFKSSQYGWARLGRIVHVIHAQEKDREITANTALQDRTRGRIEAKFKEVNTLLVNIFMYFNKQSDENKSVPQWRSVESERSVAYILEPQSYGSSFPETDRYITRELDNILIGTVYTMSYIPGKIEIQQK